LSIYEKKLEERRGRGRALSSVKEAEDPSACNSNNQQMSDDLYPERDEVQLNADADEG
jgi:hypothetical protein